MKKMLAVLLSIVIAMSCSMVAFAESTTTLTMNVPEAEYVLNIPASQTVEGLSVDFPFTFLEGTVSITDASGFAEGKNLELGVSWTEFTAEDVSTTIPYSFCLTPENGPGIWHKNGIYTFYGNAEGTVDEFYMYGGKECKYVQIVVDTNAIQKALAGTYTSVITFTTEVVAEVTE